MEEEEQQCHPAAVAVATGVDDDIVETRSSSICGSNNSSFRSK